MKRLARFLVLLSLDVLGINALFRRVHRRQAMILWYHGVAGADFASSGGYDERHVSSTCFRDHLLFLKRKGYRFVTMSELLRALDGDSGPGKLVSVTFDDGFENVVSNAYPIMLETGAKGCLYVVTGVVGSNDLLWPDVIDAAVEARPGSTFRFRFLGAEIEYDVGSEEARLRALRDIKVRMRSIPDRQRIEHMEQFTLAGGHRPGRDLAFASWDQLRQLDRTVLEIGGHTETHPDCTRLETEEELSRELDSSREDIESRIGYRVTHFAYPFGSEDDRVVERVKAAGYESAVSVEPGVNDAATDRFRLKRVCAREDRLLFRAGISGSADVVLGLWGRLRKGR
jgi:peptidoglycan/xylan/chitin deacetylase (PgdA/CDA1 family)